MSINNETKICYVHDDNFEGKIDSLTGLTKHLLRKTGAKIAESRYFKYKGTPLNDLRFNRQNVM